MSFWFHSGTASKRHTIGMIARLTDLWGRVEAMFTEGYCNGSAFKKDGSIIELGLHAYPTVPLAGILGKSNSSASAQRVALAGHECQAYCQ